MVDAPRCKPRRRWFRITPDRVVVALLAVEGLLWLSDQFRWFPFNQHKGYAVLICLATVGAAFLLMSLWFLAALVFRLSFPVQHPLAAGVDRGRRRGMRWLEVEREQARKQRRL